MATGVVMLDGSSEVKMVALDGDMRYLEFKVATKASLKPAAVVSLAKTRTNRVTFLLLCSHYPR